MTAQPGAEGRRRRLVPQTVPCAWCAVPTLDPKRVERHSKVYCSEKCVREDEEFTRCQHGGDVADVAEKDRLFSVQDDVLDLGLAADPEDEQ